MPKRKGKSRAMSNEAKVENHPDSVMQGPVPGVGGVATKQPAPPDEIAPPLAMSNDEKVDKAKRRNQGEEFKLDEPEVAPVLTGSPAGMKAVMATRKGFYGNCRIRRGNRFYIPEDEKLGKWMVLDGEAMPEEKKLHVGGQSSELTPAYQGQPHKVKDMKTVNFISR